MIEITDNRNCCGCSACVLACPKQCISFNLDKEGFHYPYVNKDQCIDCGLCEKVCPYKNIPEIHQPISVLASKNSNDSIRLKSSSGGIFTLLAESVIDDGGIVFGARFNENWDVVHDYTDKKEGLVAFRGSKYIQSSIGSTYQQARDSLQKGRKVLYTGTPCQIAGLKNYLCKEYENLLSVECVCHSVPSPAVWKKYLSAFLKKQGKSISDIKAINFRNKESGWKGYSCSVDFKDGTRYFKYREKDFWMQGFVNGLYCRPSCTNCPAKAYHSKADITIGDFWGITQLAPEIDDDKGTSVIIVHAKKGLQLLNNSACQIDKVLALDIVASRNPAITTFAKYSNKRDLFYNELAKGKRLSKIIHNMTKPPFRMTMREYISKIVRTIFPRI